MSVHLFDARPIRVIRVIRGQILFRFTINDMKLIVIALMLASMSLNLSAQWIKQTISTTANFRGLSVVNEKVIWASGSGGTVISTIDGGKTWKVMQVPEGSKLDF